MAAHQITADQQNNGGKQAPGHAGEHLAPHDGCRAYRRLEINLEGAKKQETAALQKYLKDNKISANPTTTGMYYIEKAKGTGPRAMVGKKVKVNYSGKLLNGKIFDASKDKPFECKKAELSAPPFCIHFRLVIENQ